MSTSSRRIIFCAALLASPLAVGQGFLPEFTATALTGGQVRAQQLLGQPTVLIVTPSKQAAESTKQWAKALRDDIDTDAVRVRDVLSIDLPFFMSEQDAIGRARERIPERYHDQTWLLEEPVLEKALNIPRNSSNTHVLVLDSQGDIVARTHGAPTDRRISRIEDAIASITGDGTRLGATDEQ